MEPGCSVPDPCSSNPCPANSYCRDDWDSHSCTCLTGQSGTEQMTKQRSSLCENDRNYTNYKLCLLFFNTHSLFLLASVETLCFTLFHRLLWQQLHRCMLTEPLRARVSVHEEAELLPRLHLRLFQELLWSLLRKKVRVFLIHINRCVLIVACLLCFISQ